MSILDELTRARPANDTGELDGPPEPTPLDLALAFRASFAATLAADADPRRAALILYHADALVQACRDGAGPPESEG